MKKMFSFNTKTLVATGLGAALFTLLFMYVKVPSWIPETQIQVAYGISAFFGALFGPVAGCLIAFIGHFISDSVQYGSAWWSWVIASGLRASTRTSPATLSGYRLANKRTFAPPNELPTSKYGDSKSAFFNSVLSSSTIRKDVRGFGPTSLQPDPARS